MTIVIIGAGVVGWSIAYELASRGARVRVVDGRGTAQGATRASAGILAPYTEGHIPVLRTLGVSSLALYDEFVAAASADSGAAVEYERRGTLHVAVDPAEHRLLCNTASALREGGVAHTVLDASAARALEPHITGDVVGGLHIHDHGYVSARALTDALAAAALRRGATVATARVNSIQGGDAPRVMTDRDALPADAVIVAAGTWSGLLAGGEGAGRAVKPMRGQLVQLRLKSRPATRVIWGARCYLVPWRDGSVLAGATSEDVGFDETSTSAGVQEMLRESARLLPVLERAAFEEVRVGLRPMTADELPAIGPSSTMRQVFYATGHYRNGVLLAPLTARLMADLVLEGREGSELALVRPDRLGL